MQIFRRDGVIERYFNCRSHGRGVTDRHETAILPILEDFSRSAWAISCNHLCPTSHGLYKYIAKTLPAGGMDNNRTT